MRRRTFIERLGATSLLAGAVPGWRAMPSSISSNETESRATSQIHSPGFFYRPENAWAGDFIPFYEDGTFHLFYLRTWRDIPGHGEGTPWYQVSTSDFVHFEEHGQMLARGAKDEQDLSAFTGSVIKAEGRYHIFYTGHNPYFPKLGKPQEAVLHAVSDDLMSWKKQPEEALFAPTAMYEPDDWRDPFVFWNDEAKEYWMLLAARLKSGPSRRRGCTALCTSKDLKHWEVREPFWAPGLYSVHECPDLFRLGDWWYLIFSEGSERTATHYRMSRSPKGPWVTPENDMFDGRAFYAAKTASDGHRRFLFGWLATRQDSKDYRPWQWGGNLVVHELVQASDGTLSVKVPASIDDAFHENVRYDFQPAVGDCKISQGVVQLRAPEGFACVTAGSMPTRCRIAATVDFESNTRGCGLMLRAGDSLDSAYYIRLEPGRNRLVFDSWPRPGDVPFWVELERAIKLDPQQPVDLKVFVDGSVCVVYVADKIAMSTRLYDLQQGAWGVFINEGSTRFRNVQISV